jgi:fused signal recognition particle receptor
MVFGLFKQKKDKPEAADSSKSTGIIERLKNGLSKTRKILTTDIDQLFAGNRKIDEELLEKLEELLITSDIGIRTSTELIQRISKKSSNISNADQLKKSLKEEILSFFGAQAPVHENIKSKPHHNGGRS